MDISSFYNLSSEAVKAAAQRYAPVQENDAAADFGSLFDKAIESIWFCATIRNAVPGNILPRPVSVPPWAACFCI